MRIIGARLLTLSYILLCFVCQPSQVFSFLTRSNILRASNTRRRLRTSSRMSQQQQQRQQQEEQNHTKTTHAANNDDTVPVRVLGICGGIGSGKSTVCQVLVTDFDCLGHIGKCCCCNHKDNNKKESIHPSHVAGYVTTSVIMMNECWILISHACCILIEADRFAHEVYQPNSPVLQELSDAFGSDLIQDDGALDREALGKVVFDNPQALQRLECIVWPHVQALVETRIQQLKDSYKKAVVESKKNDTTKASPKRPIIIVEAAVLLDAGWNAFSDGVWVVRVANSVALKRLEQHRQMAPDVALQRIEAQQSRRGMGNLQQEIEKGVVSAVVDNSGNVEDLKQILRKKLNDENAWYTQQQGEIQQA